MIAGLRQSRFGLPGRHLKDDPTACWVASPASSTTQSASNPISNPVVVLFLFTQRFFVQGIATTGTKG